MNTAKRKRDVILILENTGGNVAEACKAVNIHRSAFYRWKEKDPKFAAAVENATEKVKDNVESALYKNALEGNVAAQIFYLKTRCKDRGYVERQEIKHEGVELPPWMKPNESQPESGVSTEETPAG